MTFLFDRDFDAEAQAADAPPPPASDLIRLTPAELAAQLAAERALGLAEGRAQGLSEGRAEALAEAEARSAASLEALLPEVAALRSSLAAQQALRERDLIRLTRALADSLLPELDRRFGPRRLEAFCRRALRLAEGPGGLTLEVAPEALPALKAALTGATTAEGAALRLLPSAAPDAPPARATWTGGGAEFHPGALRQEILATLDLLSQEAQQAVTEAENDHG